MPYDSDHIDVSTNAQLFMRQKDVSKVDVEDTINAQADAPIARSGDTVVVQGPLNNNQNLTVVYEEIGDHAHVLGISLED